MSDRQLKYIKLIVFICPILLTLIFTGLYKFSGPLYASIIDKEYIRFFYSFLFFTSAVLSFFISRVLFKKGQYLYFIIHLIFFVVLLFLSLELIHWGQAIFKFDTFFFKRDSQLEHQMAINELIQLRMIFASTLLFFGFYGTFSWALFFKKKKQPEKGPSGLFIPGAYLSLYFFPIVFFASFILFTSFITYKINSNLLRIEEYLWVFRFFHFNIHLSRILLSLGLLIFFTRNLIWIKNVGTLKPARNKNVLRVVLIFSVTLIAFNAFFILFEKKYLSYNLYSGFGRYFEATGQVQPAIEQYNILVRKNQNDEFVNMRLSLLYQSLGEDDLATKYLAETLLKKLEVSNFNKVLIEVIFHESKGADLHHKMFSFKKGDSHRLVFNQLAVLYQYLYALNHESNIKHDLTLYLYKCLAKGRNKITIELSV